MKCRQNNFTDTDTIPELEMPMHSIQRERASALFAQGAYVCVTQLPRCKCIRVCASVQVCACVCVCLQNKTELGKNKKKQQKHAKAATTQFVNERIVAHSHRYSTHTRNPACVCVCDCGQGKNAFTRFVQNSLVFWKEKHCKEPKATERRCSAISYMHMLWVLYMYMPICRCICELLKRDGDKGNETKMV